MILNARDIIDRDIEIVRGNPTQENLNRLVEKVRAYLQAGIITDEEYPSYNHAIQQIRTSPQA